MCRLLFHLGQDSLAGNSITTWAAAALRRDLAATMNQGSDHGRERLADYHR